jgi:hypothetical protein
LHIGLNDHGETVSCTNSLKNNPGFLALYQEILYFAVKYSGDRLAVLRAQGEGNEQQSRQNRVCESWIAGS